MKSTLTGHEPHRKPICAIKAWRIGYKGYLYGMLSIDPSHFEVPLLLKTLPINLRPEALYLVSANATRCFPGGEPTAFCRLRICPDGSVYADACYFTPDMSDGVIDFDIQFEYTVAA